MRKQYNIESCRNCNKRDLDKENNNQTSRRTALEIYIADTLAQKKNKV